MHIPKTAGTSLRTLMRPHYDATEFAEIYANQFNLISPNRTFIDELKKKKGRLRVVFGHFSFGAHRLLDEPDAKYFTLLRDPIRRAVSLLGHISRDPNSRYYRLIQKGMSIRELIQSHCTAELNNHAVRMLLGEPAWGLAPAARDAAPPMQDQIFHSSHLDRAMEKIEKHFLFVGTAERFADSVALLARGAGWPSPDLINLPRQNTRSDAAPELDAETLEVLRHYNALDIALHRRFNEQPLARF